MPPPTYKSLYLSPLMEVDPTSIELFVFHAKKEILCWHKNRKLIMPFDLLGFILRRSIEFYKPRLFLNDSCPRKHVCLQSSMFDTALTGRNGTCIFCIGFCLLLLNSLHCFICHCGEYFKIMHCMQFEIYKHTDKTEKPRKVFAIGYFIKYRRTVYSLTFRIY